MHEPFNIVGLNGSNSIGVANGLFCKPIENADELNLNGRLLTPGFVDCHTHLVWAGSRADEYVQRCAGVDYLQIAKQGGGILKTMQQTRSATINELAESVIARAETMLKNGTTTIEIKASYGLSLEASKKELDAVQRAKQSIRQNVIVTFMGAHAFPPEMNSENYMRLLEQELIPMAADHPVGVKFNDCFCEQTAFNLHQTRKVMQAGIQHGLTPKVHADEFNVLGAVELACEMGAASCDHLLASGSRQFQTLAKSNTAAVVLPCTAFYLNKPYANARAMIDAGCVVALGTDYNPGTSMIGSMTFAFGLAVNKMRLSPHEALIAATETAAEARQVESGKSEPGFPADFCIWP